MPTQSVIPAKHLTANKFLLVVLFVCLLSNLVYGLPENFGQSTFATGLQDPSTMAFSPDGRLFYGERIQGNTRILESSGQILQDHFITVPMPTDGSGNIERHRSGGIRGFTFDPEYSTNGYF